MRNGLKIEWGEVTDTTSATQNVSFPLTFTKAPCVFKTVIYKDTSSNTLYVNYLSSWTFVDSVTASGFLSGGISGVSRRPFFWFAIGN